MTLSVDPLSGATQEDTAEVSFLHELAGIARVKQHIELPPQPIFDISSDAEFETMLSKLPGKVAQRVRGRIRGRIRWWGPAGRPQLQMTGIDPEYTLGRLAADRAHLRQWSVEALAEVRGDLERVLADAGL